MKNIYFILLFLISFYNKAQQPTLIKDINTVGNYTLGNYCKLGNVVYYQHNDGVHGLELWRTDGTAAGTYMFMDINPGFESSQSPDLNTYEDKLINFNGILYFTAKTTDFGSELWKSDGTIAGTVMVKDINPGPGSSFIQKLTAGIDVVVFVATYNSTNSNAVYTTDGSAAGTTVLKNISTGGLYPYVKEIVSGGAVFSNYIFINIGNQNNTNNGIFISTKGLFASNYSIPTLLPNTENAEQLLYHVNASSNNFNLYYYLGKSSFKKYNLLSNSTVTILNFTFSNPTGNYYLSKPIALNDIIYFPGSSSQFGLYKTDGTVAGTSLVKLINTIDDSNSNISNLTIYNNQIYFNANDGIHNDELWRSDGTPAGTVMTIDFIGNNIDSYLGEFMVEGSNLFYKYYTYDPVNFNRVNFLKYTASNNNIEALINLVSGEPYIYNMIVYNQSLLFSGYNEITGFELYRSDGTPASTYLLKDSDQGESGVKNFIDLGSETFFSANDGNLFSSKLWKTNGTTSGTLAVSQVDYPYYNPAIGSEFINFNGKIYYASGNVFNSSGIGNTYDYELWSTNGTMAGTTLVKNIDIDGSSNPRNFCVANNILFFTAESSYDDFYFGRELWRTDGTAAGTYLVKDINEDDGYLDEPKNLIAFNNYVYFTAVTFANGRELWRSDGTEAGTVLVSDINTLGSGGSFPENLVVHNGKLYFSAYTLTYGRELWVHDGTNTTLVKDIFPGNTNSNISDIISNGTSLFFSAYSITNGQEPWVSDGTSAGTFVININPETNFSIEGSNPANFTIFNGAVYFVANKTDFTLLPGDPYIGRELWVYSQGLFGISNLRMVSNINKAPNGTKNGIDPSYKGPFKTIGNSLFFPGTDGIHGYELWQTNGREAGTHMVVDLFTGSDDGLRPDAKIHTNPVSGRVYFDGTNGQNGRELWGLTVCPNALTLNTIINSSGQRQQAATTITSNVAQGSTPADYGNLNIRYRAGMSVLLQPGFSVEANKLPQNRKSVFVAEVGGCL